VGNGVLRNGRGEGHRKREKREKCEGKKFGVSLRGGGEGESSWEGEGSGR